MTDTSSRPTIDLESLRIHILRIQANLAEAVRYDLPGLPVTSRERLKGEATRAISDLGDLAGRLARRDGKADGITDGPPMRPGPVSPVPPGSPALPGSPDPEDPVAWRAIYRGTVIGAEAPVRWTRPGGGDE